MGGCGEQSGEVAVVTRLMRLPAAQHVTRDGVDTVTLLIRDTHTRGCDVEKRGSVTIDETSRWKLTAF